MRGLVNSFSKRAAGMARSPRRALLRRSSRRAGLVARRSWRRPVGEGDQGGQVAAAAVVHWFITAAYCSGASVATGCPGPATEVRRARVWA
ncbi:hypothetical protein [Microbispora catharanthi]|uniref:hypothetical protein n=1 Tax=Microbispora catharanthi TaxID=1712871 RepID=UPI0013766ABF|nr:hypothetical protein [Microbispora catharanthi]